MKSRIFKPELAQAIFEGRKTQTRRIIKPQPPEWFKVYWPPKEGDWICGVHHTGESYDLKSPLQVGDRFYVKETWATAEIFDSFKPSEIPKTAKAFYKDNPNLLIAGKWRSPLFMPEWAARSICEVTGVRVEQVQDITEEDAIAEGAEPENAQVNCEGGAYKNGFVNIWNEIHGEDSWDNNPWVWVYEFKKEA